ncbi:hypothetical protein KFK09_017820 [Dendrobium nobile]|uniref:Uncharacterized protein n=1 Tax=Dendrobium nobile TaxID=94219 RepID=A0A8T3AU75_DENNO|nr:hypothetical protein KFK09_017820 [Dendrobium nobile]
MGILLYTFLKGKCEMKVRGQRRMLNHECDRPVHWTGLVSPYGTSLWIQRRNSPPPAYVEQTAMFQRAF